MTIRATSSSPSTDTPPTFQYDVAVVGLGQVGLPTALAHVAGGRSVLGIDVTAEHPDSGAFRTTPDTALVALARSVIICVPTPVDRYFVSDLTALEAACAAVVAHTREGQLLTLTSTTYVGSTEDLLVRPLLARGLVAGRDVFVACSAPVTQETVPRVVGGATPACTARAIETLHGYAEQVHPVPSLATAEMTKLLENTFRAVDHRPVSL